MTRHGKIARLPAAIREEINQRLHNGDNGRDVLAWLNQHEEVRTVLTRDFGGNEINDENLSQWRKGGFLDWQKQQSTLEEARLMLAEGGELSAAAQNALADKLAVWLVGQYLLAARRLRDNANDAEGWKRLREVCHDVVKLRHGDHLAEWLRIDREKLELCREGNKRKGKSEAKDRKPAQPLTTAERQQKYRRIFGMQPV